MYRQIFTPTESDSSIPPVTIPREWYGEEVEMIIFPVNLSFPKNSDIDPDLVKERRQKREEVLKKYSFSRNGYKFDRDEANNYE
jgi:hypothetical protein